MKTSNLDECCYRLYQGLSMNGVNILEYRAMFVPVENP